MAEEKNMSSDVMIQIRGLKKSYGKLQVLRGIDLDVKRGEKMVILGAVWLREINPPSLYQRARGSGLGKHPRGRHRSDEPPHEPQSPA